MKKKTTIDFWGIGAQKCGTTWLNVQLRKQPGFSVPIKKELHYFDRSPTYPSSDDLSKTLLITRLFDRKWLSSANKHIKGLRKKGKHKRAKFYKHYYFSNYTDRWYLSLFRNMEGLKGEITPSYNFLKVEDIRKMHKLSPDAKIIFMVRNPVERAWSNYRFGNRGYNPELKDMHIEQIKEFIDGPGQSMRSNYLATIKNYSSVFPPEQILICFFDAMKSEHRDLLTRIFSFIKGEPVVPKIEDEELSKVVNPTKSVPCPPEIREYLKAKYYDMIKELAMTYGGYFGKWLEDTYGEKIPEANSTLVSAFCLGDKVLAPKGN